MVLLMTENGNDCNDGNDSIRHLVGYLLLLDIEDSACIAMDIALP